MLKSTRISNRRRAPKPRSAQSALPAAESPGPVELLARLSGLDEAAPLVRDIRARLQQEAERGRT
jgi:hypothetical protein